MRAVKSAWSVTSRSTGKLTVTVAAGGASEGARAQPTSPRQNPRTSAEPMRRSKRYLISASLCLSGAVVPSDHQTESPIQVQLHLKKRTLDPVFHGDIEGAFSEINEEALPPNFDLVRGAGRRPFPGPLLDRFSQRPPEAQLHLDPRA